MKKTPSPHTIHFDNRFNFNNAKKDIYPKNLNFEEEHKKKDLEQRFSHKNLYAKFTLWYISIWSVSLFALIIAVGLDWLEIDSYVLATLVGATTIEVIGLPLVIIKSLFPKGG